MQRAADPSDASVLVAVESHSELALSLIKHGANVNYVQVGSSSSTYPSACVASKPVAKAPFRQSPSSVNEPLPLNTHHHPS